ncbi:sugar ABC transporter ATP-binding protein [Microlunatus speluncae]|uniref:sugar ABC transporter ATP-binding protein n=1 Tax=Microlunatus speluncae TaxID=2594267 RepID=UPI0012665634|nr:sugar ABC transporter ATP-binding protein [Microlunatus speluncae]
MAPVLRCREVAKGFGGVPVLTGVSLDLEPGTVTALAGENGAGKSTLLKIASGQYRADRGGVELNGRELHGGSVTDAHRAGVAIVPQELASIPDLTVYENLFVGRELRRFGFLDRRAMIMAARQALAEFGVEIPVTARMRSLPVGLQQIVEIVKATRSHSGGSAGATVLLLDEPTSAISEREVEQLYLVVRRLRDQGVAMIYTTHKMAEIRALADRVVVLRDGNLILDSAIDDVDDDAIVTAMIGRELGTLFPELEPVPESASGPVLEVSGLRVAGAAEPIGLSVRRGEILGLAGLVGAGRTELLEAIFGTRRTTAGTIMINSRPVRRGAPAEAIRHGLALVPEDRKLNGAILGMSVLDNGTLPRLRQFSVAGWLRGRARVGAVGEAMRSVGLRSRGLGQEVGTLSGGNQQKVVLARWLTGHIDVLLLDEPTSGVDVGARSEIYRIVADLAAAGVAVIMASSDMPEILGLSHRALVLRRGAVVGELDRAELSGPDAQARIFALAADLPSESHDQNRGPE